MSVKCMNEERKAIAITIINDDEQIVVKSYLNEYRNLMVLLNDNIYLEDFGQCGGQGRCATCLVKITGLKSNTNSMERNEKATINKAGVEDSNFRLACQLLITDDLHEAVIDISEQGY